MAIGGTLLVIFFLSQAMHREREPDGYKHRDGLVAMVRPSGKGKPAVTLRPAAAKLLAEKERAARAAKAGKLRSGANDPDSPPSEM